MKKISAIIVDDEKEAREGVSLLLQQDTAIQIKALCSNGIEAIDAIRAYHPDLLFLDIQMPQVNGFDVLNSLSEAERPAIIFVTAYDDYMLKAFEVHAVDYLLKPFTDQRFYQALEHAKTVAEKKHQLQDVHQQLNALLKEQQDTTNPPQLIRQPGPTKNRLTIKADGNIHFIPFDHLVWISAYDYYIKIHSLEKTYVVRDSMKNMEKTLPEDLFLRIHKSSIVNTQYITDILSSHKGDLNVVLSSGDELRVSRNYKEKIKNLIN